MHDDKIEHALIEMVKMNMKCSQELLKLTLFFVSTCRPPFIACFTSLRFPQNIALYMSTS